MNNDGKLDLIAVASGMKELFWFENPPGSGHVIAGGFTGMINVAAWDTDGRGIPEASVGHGVQQPGKEQHRERFGAEHNSDPREPGASPRSIS